MVVGGVLGGGGWGLGEGGGVVDWLFGLFRATLLKAHGQEGWVYGDRDGCVWERGGCCRAAGV